MCLKKNKLEEEIQNRELDRKWEKMENAFSKNYPTSEEQEEIVNQYAKELSAFAAISKTS